MPSYTERFMKKLGSGIGSGLGSYSKYAGEGWDAVKEGAAGALDAPRRFVAEHGDVLGDTLLDPLGNPAIRDPIRVLRGSDGSGGAGDSIMMNQPISRAMLNERYSRPVPDETPGVGSSLNPDEVMRLEQFKRLMEVLRKRRVGQRSRFRAPPRPPRQMPLI